jgi:hypothetical protein
MTVRITTSTDSHCVVDLPPRAIHAIEDHRVELRKLCDVARGWKVDDVGDSMQRRASVRDDSDQYERECSLADLQAPVALGPRQRAAQGRGLRPDRDKLHSRVDSSSVGCGDGGD